MIVKYLELYSFVGSLYNSKGFTAEGKKIILIGSSFDEEERTIGEWKTEEVSI